MKFDDTSPTVEGTIPGVSVEEEPIKGTLGTEGAEVQVPSWRQEPKRSVIYDSSEGVKVKKRRAELGDVSFAEAILGSYNSIAAHLLQGGDKAIPYDPSFKLGVEQVEESGLPFLLIQQGVQDGSINSQEGWDDFLARNEQAREYQEVLADYNPVTKFVGGIIPSLVDPYNAADIAFTAGLAALPVAGWGALAARTSLAAVTGGASAYLSEKSIQRSNASYDNEALELAVWLGAGLGAATYGVGNALTTKRHLASKDAPVNGQVVIDSVTGETRIIKNGVAVKSGATEGTVYTPSSVKKGERGGLTRKEVKALKKRRKGKEHDLKRATDKLAKLDAALEKAEAVIKEKRKQPKAPIGERTAQAKAQKAEEAKVAIAREKVKKAREGIVKSIEALKKELDEIVGKEAAHAKYKAAPVSGMFAGYKRPSPEASGQGKSATEGEATASGKGDSPDEAVGNTEVHGDGIKSTETPYYDVGNWWSLSIAGQMKKSLSNAVRQFAHRIDVSGADSGKYLNTEETARSMMFEFEKAGGILLQGLNGERHFHKLSAAEFDKKVNDAYADFINKGKDLNKVPDDMKESIKMYHEYNEFIKGELKSIGVPVKDDYFRHHWKLEEVLLAGELKFKADFKLARRSKVEADLSNVNKIIETLKKQIEEVGSYKKGEEVTIINMDGTKTVHTTGQRARMLNALRQRLKRAEEGKIGKGQEKGWKAVTKEMIETALEKEASSVWKSLADKDPSDRFFLNVTSRRKLPELDESMMKDYFHADIASAVVHNSRFLAGRVATMKRYGFSDEKGMKKYIDKLALEALEAGDSKKYVAKFKLNAEMSIKNLWHTQMTPANPNGTGNLVTQFVLKTNTIAMGLSFGSTALASEGVAMFTRGTLEASFKSIGMGMKELKNTIQGVPADSLAYRQQQILMGAFEVLDHKTYDRYLVGDDLADGGNKLLRAATAVQSAVMKASMLAPITQNIRIALGHVKLDDMFNMDFAKLSVKDKKHYTRMQFDYNDIKRMQDFKEKITIKDSEGNFNGYDFTKLPPDLARSIDRYMGNLSRHDVILGERIHMPAIFSSNNAYSKLLTQYLGFPAQAYESLLLKGIQEADARLATATMFQVMAISTMALAREEMEIKAGLKHELDRKYTFDGEGLAALATHGLLKNSHLAPLTFAADTFSKALTGQSLNSDYRQYNAFSAFGGVSAGRLQTTYEAITKLGFDYLQYGGTGWNTGTGRALAVNGIIPGVYAPGLNLIWNKINHDMEYGN